MRVAGIRTTGAPVELFEVPEPRQLAGDEVLIEVMAAGVGNWDEFVRTGAARRLATCVTPRPDRGRLAAGC